MNKKLVNRSQVHEINLTDYGGNRWRQRFSQQYQAQNGKRK